MAQSSNFGYFFTIPGHSKFEHQDTKVRPFTLQNTGGDSIQFNLFPKLERHNKNQHQQKARARKHTLPYLEILFSRLPTSSIRLNRLLER